MATTMKAGVVHAFGKPLTIELVAIPTPWSDEVLIKAIATGVGPSDLHAADGDWLACRRFRLSPAMKVRASLRRAVPGSTA